MSDYLFYADLLEGILKEFEVADVLVLQSSTKFHFL